MTSGLANEAQREDIESVDAFDLDLLPSALNRPAPVVDRPPRARIEQAVAVVVMRSRAFASDGFQLEREFGHLFHWTPVFLGAGAAWWFALDRTPAVAPTLLLCIGAAVTWLILGPWRPALRAIAAAALLMTAGALLAAWQTARADTVILDGPVTTTVRGIVIAREVDSRGRWRYEINLAETEKPRLKRAPQTIRVTSLGHDPPLAIGATIEGRARLSPPSGPALAGLNDFAFDSYFDGLGASGFFYGKPKAWANAPPISQSLTDKTMQVIDSVQIDISARIRSILPGDTGAFAASMVTDDRHAMSQETTEALRLAGLTHIIAISGLNMALAAGLCFVGLRLLLSLSQEFSHRWPVKKIAAAGALVTVTLYYLISGFSVSAERAYIMMAIMLTAVFFDRPSISLRNIALSAIVIAVASPSAMIGPGFQMSYAATLALVTGYSTLQRRMQSVTPISGIPLLRRLMPAARFMAGVFMTSLIGGLSTALFSIEYFNRIATWGLPANLLAMPIISLIVMPAAIVALFALPFGLEWLPVKVMGYGLDFVIAMAKWIAAQRGEWITGQIPAWLFVGMTFGLITLAIMRSHLCYAGAVVCIVLLAVHLALPAAPKPSLIIFEDGSLAGIVDGETAAVSESRPSDFILQQWQRALKVNTVVKPDAIAASKIGAPTTKADKRQRLTQDEINQAKKDIAKALAKTPAGRFACAQKQWCVATTASGLVIIIATNAGLTGAACDLADIVVTPARLKWSDCRSGAQLFTGQTLRKTGSLEVYVVEKGDEPPTVTVVGAMDGKSRAWMRHRRYDWHTDTFAEN